MKPYKKIIKTKHPKKRGRKKTTNQPRRNRYNQPALENDHMQIMFPNHTKSIVD
jgi:hypothetical protein